MGMVRKTVSIGTLGLVSFRSKKEKLRRAERSQRDAEARLESEHAARVDAEDTTKRLQRSRRRDRRRRQAILVAETVALSRRARRRARRAAKKSARSVQEKVSSAVDTLGP
jgi:hypothetical protein